jgi:tellurite methyltransferase
VYQLDALRLAVEGSQSAAAAFADAFEARMKRLELRYVADGMRHANRSAGDAVDPLVREGLPVVRAKAHAAAAGSRKELLAQGIDALDRASERLKQPEAAGGTGELDPERGAHLRKLKQATASASDEPLWVKDPGLDPARQPKKDERRATQQLSAAMLDALQAQTQRGIGNDPAQLPAAKRAIEDLVFKAFSTDESFGRHLGNQLAFDRAESERKFRFIRTVHGFIDVGAVGVTNRLISRFGGDAVLTAVHATAAEVARRINKRLELSGGKALEVFAVGGDEIRFISSELKVLRRFEKAFTLAMRQATIEGTAGDTPAALQRVQLRDIPVYIGIGRTKEEAEARSNAAKAADPKRVPGRLPPGYLTEQLGNLSQARNSPRAVGEAQPQSSVAASDPVAAGPILDALAGTGWVEAGQLKANVMEGLLRRMQRELAAELGLQPDEVPLLTAAVAAAWSHWSERAVVDSSAVRRRDELQPQLTAALVDLAPQLQPLDGPPSDASGGSEWAPFYRVSATLPPRPELLRAMDAVRTSTVGQPQALDLGSGAAVATGAMLANTKGFKVLAVDPDPLAQQYMQPLQERHGSSRVRFVPGRIANAVLPLTDLVWAGFSLPYLGRAFAHTWPRITNAIRPGGVFAGDFFGDKHWGAQQPDANAFVFHRRAEVQQLFAGFDLLELNEVDDQVPNDEGVWRTHTFSVVARKQGGEAKASVAGSIEPAQALPPGWGVRTVINEAGDGTFELTNERGDSQAEIEVQGLRRASGVARIVSSSAQDASLLERAEAMMAQNHVRQVIVQRVPPRAAAFYTAAGYRPDPRSNAGGWIKDIATPDLSIQASAADPPLTSLWAHAPITSQVRPTVWSRAGGGGEPATNRPILDALQGTDLLQAGRLNDDAWPRLFDAQRAVAREFGVRRQDVSMHAAALKAAERFWTAQAADDEAAFGRARSAQAEQRAAVQALPRQPVQQAAADEQPRETTAIAAVSPEITVAAFLATVPPLRLAQWNIQLTGGPALEPLLKREAQAGRPLTADGVQALVSSQTPLVKPPRLTGQIDVEKMTLDSAYELRFDSRKEMHLVLGKALSHLRNEAMQIRTPDGRHRFDLYRHDGGGYAMLDDSTGNALPVSSDEDVISALTTSLRIMRDDSGSLVVSYGSTPAILAAQPLFYMTRQQIEQMLVEPQAPREPMTAHTVEAITGLIARGEIVAAPGIWDAARHMPVPSRQQQAARTQAEFEEVAYAFMSRQTAPDPLLAAQAVAHLQATQREADVEEKMQQVRQLFEQVGREALARLPDLDWARERHTRIVALASELTAARRPEAQRVRAMAAVVQQRIEAEQAARLPHGPQSSAAVAAGLANPAPPRSILIELRRLLQGDSAQLDAADRVVAELQAAAAALRAEPVAGADIVLRAEALATVAHEMLRQSRADRARQAGDAPLMLTPRNEPAANNHQVLQPLVGTRLVEGGQLTADAVARLAQARRTLAAEVGRQPQDISLDIAALKVGQDYWTARIGREADAFERARGYQSQLEQAMAPLRQEASARKAADSELTTLRSDYEQTLAAIQEVKPDFDGADIGRTTVGEVTLQQLEAAMPPADHARLSLQIARQYLDHYRAAAQPTSASSAVQRFLSQVEPNLRARWEEQLVGGAPLHGLLLQQAQAGQPLDARSVDQLVALNEPVLRPPNFVDPALPSRPVLRTFAAQRGSVYELRFSHPVLLRSLLAAALKKLPFEPMQIRTADNTRRFDIYRHAGQGQTIIDQSSGDALPGAQDEPVQAMIKALGVVPQQAGALVVSYGDTPAVMANDAVFYWTQQQIDDWLDKPPGDRSPVTRSVEQALFAAALKNGRETSPEWRVDSRVNLDEGLLMLHQLGIEPDRIDDNSARQLLVLMRDQARDERQQWLGRDNPPWRLLTLANYIAGHSALSHNLPLTHLVDSGKVGEWNDRLIGGPSLHDVLWRELQAGRPLTTDNIDRAVSRNTPGEPPQITDPLPDSNHETQ